VTWPSTFPQGTLGYMKDRIADELGGRPDLATQIAACIGDAIAACQPHRFRFSESRDVCQFSTVAAQEFYTAADNPAIATLFMFDYVTVTLGVTNFAINRRRPEDVELLSQTGTQRGMPLVFSYYNEQLRFYPVPDNAYPILVAGHMNIAAPASDSAAGNRWMTDAERLIRSRAKYELSLNYGVDYPDLANRMHPENGATADAYSELKQAANKLTGRGRVTPTVF
jgi:hypothetical protein